MNRFFTIFILLFNLFLSSCEKSETTIAEVDYLNSCSIAIVPDIQVYTRTPDNPYLGAITSFINNSDFIHHTLLTGDLTDSNYVHQWENAKLFLNSIENKSYSFCLGNHDYGDNGFTQDRNSKCQQFITNTNIDGCVNGNIDNSYSFIDVYGAKFCVISLEFGPRDMVLDWADSLIQANSDVTFIVLTHAFLNGDGNVYDRTYDNGVFDSPFSYPISRNQNINDGRDIWNTIIVNNPNVRFVICGHSNAPNGHYFKTEVNNYGEKVFEILVNYQFFPNGGNGYLGLLSFFSDYSFCFTIYSPYLNLYNTKVYWSIL